MRFSSLSKNEELSKGMQQKIQLISTFIHEPDLLIFDEPFSGLDPVGRREFIQILADLKSHGTSILISSHILNDVELFCDRAAILIDGELKADIDLKNLSNIATGHYELRLLGDLQYDSEVLALASERAALDRFTCLRFQDAAQAHQALALACAQALHIESFGFIHGGLEEFFVSLVEQQPRSEGTRHE